MGRYEKERCVILPISLPKYICNQAFLLRLTISLVDTFVEHFWYIHYLLFCSSIGQVLQNRLNWLETGKTVTFD